MSPGFSPMPATASPLHPNIAAAEPAAMARTRKRRVIMIVSLSLGVVPGEIALRVQCSFRAATRPAPGSLSEPAAHPSRRVRAAREVARACLQVRNRASSKLFGNHGQIADRQVGHGDVGQTVAMPTHGRQPVSPGDRRNASVLGNVQALRMRDVEPDVLAPCAVGEGKPVCGPGTSTAGRRRSGARREGQFRRAA